MPRSMWTGAISFGLVNVPVRLYPAVRSKSLSFVQLHDKDGGRIRYRKVCELDGEEVSADEIVKAHEIAPGQYVKMDREDFEAADPAASRTIDIEEFVELSQIDPIYYDHAYYLGPFNESADRAYRLLVDAMQAAGKTALARFVMRGKEYLAALRAVDGVLVLSTMNRADEILPKEEVGAPGDVEVREKELKMATQLVESLTADFEPEKFEDTYRERLLEIIERKAEGEEIVAPPQAEAETGQVVDLMAALESSLADARRARQTKKTQAKPAAKKKAAKKRSGGKSGG